LINILNQLQKQIRTKDLTFDLTIEIQKVNSSKLNVKLSFFRRRETPWKEKDFEVTIDFKPMRPFTLNFFLTVIKVHCLNFLDSKEYPNNHFKRLEKTFFLSWLFGDFDFISSTSKNSSLIFEMVETIE